MRLAWCSLVVGLVMSARPSRADNVAVVADCKSAITSSMVGGYGIRIVSGGFTPGVLAYVHELPSTNSKTKQARVVATLNVKQGVKPMNNTVEMNVVSDEADATFQLVIKKAKTAGGEFTATLEKSKVSGTELGVQDMVCTLPGMPAAATTCDASKKPVACPGGGLVSCVDGTWHCPPLPHR